MFGRNKKTGASYEARGASHSRARHPSRSRLAPRPSLLPSNSRLAPRASRLPQRRGVLLLVVLSMLVLFLMIGTAFVIVAKQSEKVAKIQNANNLKLASQASQGDLLDEVLLQLVRDTYNPASSLRGHSLLADMYGNDGFRGQIANVMWAKGDAANVGANPTLGQMIQFTFTGGLVDLYDAPYEYDPTPGVKTSRLSSVDDAYAGQLVTFVGRGPAQNVTTRIVGYRPTGPNAGVFTVLAFPLADGSLISDPALLNGSRVLVNGRPFNGTGVGFDPKLANPASTTPRLAVKERVGTTNYELALLPNSIFFDSTQIRGTFQTATSTADPTLLLPAWQRQFVADGNAALAANLAKLVGPQGAGGSDEPYDAPDFQNMLLALLNDEPEENNNPTSGTLEDTILPSLHRPDLLNYWNKRFGSGPGPAGGSQLAANAPMLRKVLLRPNWQDHPNFTGSNREFAESLLAFQQNPDLTARTNLMNRLIFGPWDVDNDGDGFRDSIWVDAGLPVMEGPNGEQVKPLVAIMCIDLDGRVNVNVHGSLDLANIDNANDSLNVQTLAGAAANNPGPQTNSTPRGAGWGPADVSLEAALGNDFRRIMVGDVLTAGGVDRRIPGRYGEDNRPGRGNILDQMTQVTLTGWPQWGNQESSKFAMPPDLRVRYGHGVNLLGQLVIEAANLASERRPSNDGRLTFDSPYEATLFAEGVDSDNGTSAVDAPFSFAELELCLRVFDADAGSLPSRLAFLSGVYKPGNSDPSDRMRITTDQWDVPVPNISTPPEMESLLTTNANSRRLPQTAAELLEIRVRQGLFPNDNAKRFPLALAGDPNDPTTDAGMVRRVMQQLLAPELAAGVRLNINRALGNGRDDQENQPGAPGYGVVDEPGEEDPTLSRKTWRQNSDPVNAEQLDATFINADFIPLEVTYDGDPEPGVIDGDDAWLQRQLLARHIYVTALTMTAPANFGSTATEAADQALCRRLAQWAINAVDFRDVDNIMTPFEYDLDPFDGWNPDGDLLTTNDRTGVGTKDDTVVWGAERPELVITETLAMHNRNTEDTGQEDPYPPEDRNGITADDPTQPDWDPDFDQRVRPRGALFVELYNPWAPNPGATADIHDTLTEPGSDLGVNLKATDPSGSSPVWRMAIYKRVDVYGRDDDNDGRVDESDEWVHPNAAELWDPDDPDPALRPNRRMDRSVYFTGFDPGFQDDGTAYYADQPKLDQNVPNVRPGRYLVVGSGDDFDNDGVYTTPFSSRLQPGPQRRIELDTNRAGTAHKVRIIDDTDAPAFDRQDQISLQAPREGITDIERVPGDNSASMTDVAIIDRAAGGKRRLSLSEPNIGYPNRFRASRWTDDGTGEGQYRNAQGEPAAIDVPLDGPIGVGDTLQTWRDYRDTYPDPNFPMPEYLDELDPALTTVREMRPVRNSRTADEPRISYAFIYLQRLANPLLPYNPPVGEPGHDPNQQVNPYFTIDRMSANLTVYNGREPTRQEENMWPMNGGDDSGRGTTPGEARRNFASLERGFSAVLADAEAQRQPADRVPALWTFERPSIQPMINRFFVGRNAATRLPELAANDSHVFIAIPYCTLGYLNTTFADTTQTGEDKQAKPFAPFPWMAWNNRPYISANELTMVPRVRMSQLLRQFTTAEYVAAADASPYSTAVIDKPTPQNNDPITQDQAAFAHLENFLYEGPNVNQQPIPGVPIHLYRIFDLVGTPSLFNGAQTWLNPQMNGVTILGVGTPPTPDDPRWGLRPPFNAVSAYREPGKINLNTIFGEDVWRGIFHGDPDPDEDGDTHPGPQWEDFIASRRGYVTDPATNEDILALDARAANQAIPTFFGNPFRSGSAAAMVPLASMIPAGNQRQPIVGGRGAEATLFRSSGVLATQLSDASTPLFFADTDERYNNADQCAFFRYAPVIRLNNLLTTRSNVYAVWITVGFFEVEPAPTQAVFNAKQTGVTDATILEDLYRRVYPDGYQFGREAGLDEGEVTRLRGFYIIDRSRPAAFEPGVDNNVENIIRLRRRIE